MKKTRKIVILCVVIVLVVAVLGFTGYAVYNYVSEKDITETENRYANLAKEFDNVGYNESSGMLYINNEIIVIANVSANETDIQALAKKYNAEIADQDPDLGVYLFQFADDMKMSELEDLVESLQGETAVDQALINPVVDMGTDVEEAVYPNDPWAGDDWDLSAPSGENWGMEAIDAPGAWAYLDRLQTVNVGVIDTLVSTEHEDLDISVFLTSHENGTTEYNTMQYEITTDLAGDHGCHVAGIIGAKWNNNVGASGVMGNKATLYNSVVDSFGSGSDYVDGYYSAYDYVKAIKVLTDRGVQAINISQNSCRLIGFAASRGNKKAINMLTSQAEVAGALLNRLIDNIKTNGGKDFVICVSAGNSNNTAYYKDENATYGYTETRELNIFKKAVVGNSEAKYNNFLALIDEEAVKDRIIVVGSVRRNANGRDELKENPYVYSEYSCVGDRVDIVAPGDVIYSLVASGYDSYSGTSMAAPHVTGVAGLAFAANPSLSGPEVKEILVSLSTGRYYYGEHYSGLVNARYVVEYALGLESSETTNVQSSGAGLDLCFLIDTTGSMEDDIDNAKANMVSILENLSKKSPDYRVAIVDYRDFASRTGSSEDYPAKVQLPFTGENETILQAIQRLTLGGGGDAPETVYSAIHESLKLDWRPKAKKILIILGDAPPLDPEPVTGYTYDDAIEALYNAQIGIDTESSDSRVLGEPDKSKISVFTIGIGSRAADFFNNIAEDTGGEYTEIYNAEEVSDAIIGSIDKIEVTAANVAVAFGEAYSNETVMLYTEDGDFVFSFQLNGQGKINLENMAPGDYEWEIERLAKGGKLRISLDDKKPKVTDGSSKWYSFVNVIWYRHRVLLFVVVAAAIVLPILISMLVKKGKKKKESTQPEAESESTPPTPQPPESAEIAEQPLNQ